MQVIENKNKIKLTDSTCLCNSYNHVGKHKCNMLLTLESNNNSSNGTNKSNNNNNYNNNCLTSMTCLCGCISCCHSKAATKATSLTTPTLSSSSTNTIISSTETKISTTMKASTSASSSSTKDNSNYMHCANAFNIHTCYNCDINKENNNSDRCCNMNSTRSNSLYKTTASNSFRNCILSINNNLNSIIKYVIVLMFLTCCDLSQAALRDVNLYIEPPAVRQNQSVTLRCHYTIEGAPLYSVKFYRGQLEFFRYTPGEYPNTKVFHFPGIKVDESVSNATQVVIRNVNFGLSGTFSCEVTADAPLFSTATAYAQMQVVEFPDKRPQLFTELTRYEPGDVLRANCSTPPSRPRAELRFTINNIPVSSEETQYIRTVDNLIASRLSLKVQLQAIHFAVAAVTIGNGNSHMINALNSGSVGSTSTSYSGSAGSGGSASGGALLLRCTAQIDDLYQEYKEIELGTPQKDPVPARVTSSGGGFRGFLETYFGPSSGAEKFNFKHLKLLLTTSSILIIFFTFYQSR
ncbi:uncharacterized protein LOC111674830 [Lucilia cuprina]|uniref:uncharacterized protein LOC111674830 n=1 Tax=Lucilia cuprina TaxID=7375 RepID=UPI001F06086A|nr:uncharacterized protein LOC111674830 [Lucilia cuprina]